MFSIEVFTNNTTLTMLTYLTCLSTLQSERNYQFCMGCVSFLIM